MKIGFRWFLKWSNRVLTHISVVHLKFFLNVAGQRERGLLLLFNNEMEYYKTRDVIEELKLFNKIYMNAGNREAGTL